MVHVSRAESAEYFISFAATEAEASAAHQRKVDSLGGCVQPYVTCIGRVDAVEYCIVTFLKYKVRLDTILQAVDFCFHLFHVFNVPYPPQAKHLWQVLEISFYGLSDSLATLTTPANNFRLHFQRFLQSGVAIPKSVPPLSPLSPTPWASVTDESVSSPQHSPKKRKRFRSSSVRGAENVESRSSTPALDAEVRDIMRSASVPPK